MMMVKVTTRSSLLLQKHTCYRLSLASQLLDFYFLDFITSRDSGRAEGDGHGHGHRHGERTLRDNDDGGDDSVWAERDKPHWFVLRILKTHRIPTQISNIPQPKIPLKIKPKPSSRSLASQTPHPILLLLLHSPTLSAPQTPSLYSSFQMDEGRGRF